MRLETDIFGKDLLTLNKKEKYFYNRLEFDVGEIIIPIYYLACMLIFLAIFRSVLLLLRLNSHLV